MRFFFFLMLSVLALPTFASNSISKDCCPNCQEWGQWALSDFNAVIYHPQELPLDNLLDCVMLQQRFIAL